MSKRKISKKQNARIEKKQKDLHANTSIYQNASEGLVITRYSTKALLEDNEKNLMRCQISPAVKNIVAGDKVIYIREDNNLQGLIVSRCPRISELSRPVKEGAEKAVAANITQLIIVLSAKPEVSWPLLDSYLVIAELQQLEVLIILNKTDLPSREIKNRLHEQYQTLNYQILLTNHHDVKSIDCLKDHLQDQVSVFVGQSGVGKSSLISACLPSRHDIQIGHIAEKTELGRHTTSNSTYYHLEIPGAIIDSPGVREFGL